RYDEKKDLATRRAQIADRDPYTRESGEASDTESHTIPAKRNFPGGGIITDDDSCSERDRHASADTVTNRDSSTNFNADRDTKINRNANIDINRHTKIKSDTDTESFSIASGYVCSPAAVDCGMMSYA